MFTKSVKSMMFAAVLGILALGVCAQSAYAGTATATLAVSATVANSCVLSNGTLAFGQYTGALVPQNTTLTLTCTKGDTWTLTMGTGTTSGATLSNRMMANGTNTLNYTLYTDNSYTKVFDNSSSANELSATGTGAQQTANIYGAIPAGQYPPAGSYTDSVTATITF